MIASLETVEWGYCITAEYIQSSLFGARRTEEKICSSCDFGVSQSSIGEHFEIFALVEDDGVRDGCIHKF
jgi:hypothetical protein